MRAPPPPPPRACDGGARATGEAPLPNRTRAAPAPHPHLVLALLVHVLLVLALPGHVVRARAALVERDQQVRAVVAPHVGQARSVHLLLQGCDLEGGFSVSRSPCGELVSSATGRAELFRALAAHRCALRAPPTHLGRLHRRGREARRHCACLPSPAPAPRAPRKGWGQTCFFSDAPRPICASVQRAVASAVWCRQKTRLSVGVQALRRAREGVSCAKKAGRRKPKNSGMHFTLAHKWPTPMRFDRRLTAY